jgi:hypothetical protein
VSSNAVEAQKKSLKSIAQENADISKLTSCF